MVSASARSEKPGDFSRADARFFAYGVFQQYRHVAVADVRFLSDCFGEMGMPIRLHSIIRIIVVNAITGSGADMSIDCEYRGSHRTEG